MSVEIKRALVSVSDKKGIVDFCRSLQGKNVDIFSTGGTYKVLSDNNIKVSKVEELTGFPEMLDGRVKTLHPMIHGGILADRKNQEHLEEVRDKKINLIDMVVVNLYPFKKTISKKDVNFEDAIENIDIGGPTMIRSAAKNHRGVAVLVDPGDYEAVIEELDKNDGKISDDTLFNLSLKAFQHTCEYDSVIFNYFADLQVGFDNTGLKIRPYLDIDCSSAETRKIKKTKSAKYMPDEDIFRDDKGVPREEILVNLSKVSDLRYGENPHQKAAYYKIEQAIDDVFVNARQLQGKQLSYNNILDANSAFMIVKEFSRPCVAVIKHTNPCGAAVSDDIASAYRNAYRCDPVSAFGSIVASNCSWTMEASDFLKDKYVEVLIAPGFDKEALKVLESKKDLRILKVEYDSEKYVSDLMSFGFKTSGIDIKSVDGGMLIQDLDEGIDDNNGFKVVTKTSPSDEQMDDMIFGWQIIKNIKSNAILLVKAGTTTGVGAGQMSRVDAARLAIEKSGGRADGSVLISDAFFPFKDTIELASENGIKAIIQPGGSVNDDEVIKACDDANIAMIFTGKRHFKH